MEAAGRPQLVVRLLGGVHASLDGVDLDLGPPGPRSLFAVLALRANTVVTREELTDALWGENPPRTADGNIYSYVSNIRKVVEPGRSGGRGHNVLVRSRGGYLLTIPPDGLDLARFAKSASAARTAMAAGDHAKALGACDVALSLWRGHAFGGAVGPLVEAERNRLDLRRLEVQELRCEALLETGSAPTAVGELSSLIALHPLNERLHELRMLAMYRSGRQAEALQVYQQVRVRLADELGVDPGPSLQRLYQRVLAADPALSGDVAPGAPAVRRDSGAPVRSRAVPAQLPHSVPVLAGRAAEMARLREICTPAANGVAVSSVVISAIDGIAGVGKTAMALHTAHQMAPHFPDGQLFVDLRGFDPQHSPLTPEEALGHLVRSLGAEPDPVADLGEKAALYRSLLSGRKILIVLDNAASVEQVRPLLPGTAGCLALVTSRNRMAGLVARDGAARLALDSLTMAGSLELLRGVLGTDVVDAELEAASELAQRCGHLPLALRIAAERIAGGDFHALSEMVDELRVEQNRLDTLSTPDDPLSTVRAVFSWSYRTLKSVDARAFRLLSVHPGGEVDIDVAAAVFGTDRLTARRHLESLDRRSLLQRLGPHRYRMHDLLLTYAAECAGLDEPPELVVAAVERLVRWYLTATVAARSMVMPEFAKAESTDAGEGARPRFATYDDAIRWTNDQLATIEAVVHLAVDRGHLELATRIATASSVLYHCTSRWTDWLRMAEFGQAAAKRIGDDRRRAFLCNDTAQASHQLGHEDDALRYFTTAAELLRSLPDQTDPAIVDNLAVSYATMSLHTNSVTQMEENWDMVRAHGTTAAVSTMSMSFCFVLSRAGRHEEAMEYGRQGVAGFREMDSSYILGQALLFLGEACARARELEQADRHYGEALEVWRRHDDRQRTAQTMHAIARTRHQMGRDVGVRALLREALATIDECGYTRANVQERQLMLDLLDELAG
jgi:DNA-binding SARP family transcriptional activator